MAKIDLSGKGGWQSKAGDKLKAIEKGAYDIRIIEMMPGKFDTDFLKIGNMLKVTDGTIKLQIESEEYLYEAEEIIVIDETNVKAEIIISDKVTLELFEEKKRS